MDASYGRRAGCIFRIPLFANLGPENGAITSGPSATHHGEQSAANPLGGGAVNQVCSQRLQMHAGRIRGGSLRQSQRRHHDFVRDQPNGSSEGHSGSFAYASVLLSKLAVDCAYRGSEGVVDKRPGYLLLPGAEFVSEDARNSLCEPDRGIV